MLYVETEVHYVTVLYNIILAFHVEFTGITYGCFGTKLNVIIVLDYLGTDKAFLKIGMDNACALRGFPTLAVGPCLDLHWTGGDECLQVEQTEGRFYQTVYARFLQAKLLEEHLTVLIALQLGNLALGIELRTENIKSVQEAYNVPQDS